MIDDVLLYWTDLEGKKTDITRLAGNIQWSENKDSHAMNMRFTLPDTAEKYIEHIQIQAGEKIQLLYRSSDMNPTKREVRYSFIVTEAARNYPQRNIVCKDFAWYMEKNEISIMFGGESIDNAIKTVCAKLGVEIAEIPSMPACVNKTYVGEDVETILEELIDIQQKSDGREYDYEMTDTKLRVYCLGNDAESYMYKPAENVNEFDVTFEHTRCTYKHSIEDMKNSVTAIIKSNTEGNLPALEYTIEDNDNIAKYGKLKTYIDVQAEQQYEIGVLAKNELTDKNRVSREITTSMIGAINARKNRVMMITDEYLGIDKVPMRICSCNHKLNNGIYTMDIDLEMIKDYKATNLSTDKIQREEIDLTGAGTTYFDELEGMGDFEKLYSCAKKYLGVPYVLGGSSPKGFDCSGFVCYVLRESGAANVGRTTAQGLYNMTKRVKSPKPGDLVFWTGTNPNSKNLITHVGLCIGNGKNIQAGGSKVHVGSNKGAYAYGRFG